MGTFMHPITLHSPDGSTSEVVEALVDTGATFTSIPAPILESLGVFSDGFANLRLANGQVDRRPIGEVRADLGDGAARTIVCVFSDPSGLAVIGAVTLEVFLLGIDPVAQRLVPVDGYWASADEVG